MVSPDREREVVGTGSLNVVFRKGGGLTKEDACAVSPIAGGIQRRERALDSCRLGVLQL